MQAELDKGKALRFLFTTNTGYGHFHPLMPLALALKEAGHEVAFAASASLQQVIEANSFTFFPIKLNFRDDEKYQQLKQQLQELPLNLESELFAYPRIFGEVGTRLRLPQLLEIARTWQADMLIREAGEYAAVIVAEHLGLPHAVVAFAAALKGHTIFERELANQLDPLRLQYGLKPDSSLESLYRYLQLSYTPPLLSLQLIEDADQKVPATTHFIRPQFFNQATNQSLPDWLNDLPSKPTVYLTMGTEVNKEPTLYPHVLQTVIAGLQNADINLIVTLGKDKDPADFGPQPAHIHIERYLPQNLLLPHCDLMIMHGGSNTLLEALDLGMPLIVVPLIADQFFNAELVQKLALGKIVPFEQLTATNVKIALKEVLANPLYRENAKKMQAEMRQLPGQEYAVKLVEQVLKTRQPLLNPNFYA